jgi:MFS family permease
MLRAADRQTSPQTWDTRYEIEAIGVLTLGFGLVGLDRFIINPLSPVIMRDLHLDYRDLGNMAAAVALTWGLSALFLGRLSDRVGRREVLIPTVVAFSVLVGCTGFAQGITSLLVLRALMGFAEGGFAPSSIAVAMDASHPRRRGFNLGFHQNGLPLIGLGLGPVLATQLLAVLPSWRWVFVLLTLPGLITAYLMHRIVRNAKPTIEDRPADATSHSRSPWSHALSYRNVVLGVGIMSCVASALNVAIVMSPTYLTEELHLPMTQMGFVMSAVGIGAVLGGFTLPALSDLLGRKPVLVGACALACVFLALFMKSAANAWGLFAWLLLFAGFGFSVIYVTVGPLTAESVPPTLVATAIGLITGTGEIIGGAGAPALAGQIAHRIGVTNAYVLALLILAIGFLLTLAVREPAAGRSGAATVVRTSASL